MQRNKPGLADLKKLRQALSATEPAVPERTPARVSRKRSLFLPPGRASGVAPAAAPADTPTPPAPVARPSLQQGGKTGAPGKAGATGKAKTASSKHPPGPPISPAASTPVSESDRKLFLSAVRYVEKIKAPNRVMLPPVSVAPETILEERRLRAAGIDAKVAKAARKATAVPEVDTPGLVPREANPVAPPPVATRAGKLSDSYSPSRQHQDDSRFLRAGHGPEILRDLQRGRWPIGASLDLHGSTLEDARDRFERFLSSCLTHDVKCVRIIHGKGHGSPNGDAVLKTTVRRWLAQLDDVIAYVECSESDGGAGAVQVLLK